MRLSQERSPYRVSRGLDTAARKNLPCSQFDGPGTSWTRSEQQAGATRGAESHGRSIRRDLHMRQVRRNVRAAWRRRRSQVTSTERIPQNAALLWTPMRSYGFLAPKTPLFPPHLRFYDALLWTQIRSYRVFHALLCTHLLSVGSAAYAFIFTIPRSRDSLCTLANLVFNSSPPPP